MRINLPEPRPWGAWRLWHNFPQKLGALFASVVLWYAAGGEGRAVVERTLEARLRPINVSEGRVVSDLPATIRVTLSGTRSRLESVTPDLVEATVDVAGLPDGPFEARVVVTPPAETRVARYQPVEVSGTLDEVVRESVEVRVALVDPPRGALVRLSATPEGVTGTGARSRLSRVAYALALAPPDLAPGREVEVDLTPVDAERRAVEGVTLRPDSVRLTRSESAALLEKTVPLALGPLPLPGGFEARNLTLRPPAVRVVGPPETIEGLARLAARVPGTLSPGAVTVPLTLELPPGVQPLESASLSVTVAPAGR